MLLLSLLFSTQKSKQIVVTTFGNKALLLNNTTTCLEHMLGAFFLSRPTLQTLKMNDGGETLLELARKVWQAAIRMKKILFRFPFFYCHNRIKFLITWHQHERRLITMWKCWESSFFLPASICGDCEPHLNRDFHIKQIWLLGISKKGEKKI